MGVFKFLSVCLVLCGSLWAMPALNRFFRLQQPDGSSLKVRSVGNESYSYKVTEDGFVVARDSAGYFCYVGEDGSVSKVRAHEEGFRSLQEQDYLGSLNKRAVIQLLKSRMGKDNAQDLPKLEGTEPNSSPDIPVLRKMSAANVKTIGSDIKALVILVQFDDVKFSSEDPKADFEKYLNQEGYNENKNLGSVRDYFIDNSMGKFVPSFDVVGPITLNYSVYKDFGPYSRYGNNGAAYAVGYALDSLKKYGTVDFKLYDNDGDYVLDYVHMIYAGLSASDSRQDSALWPHRWFLSGVTTNPRGLPVASSGNGFSRKNYYVDAYAISHEIDGMAWDGEPSVRRRVGVGAFIHEFSHLMGLGDHYATDESDIFTPGRWDVMDAGPYNMSAEDATLCSAPPYYSGFERMQMGWMDAEDLQVGDNQQLGSINSNAALKLTNPKNANEFYVVEYREPKKWDSGLPNHGMLIWHIDYEDSAWKKNEINIAERMRVDLIEADGKADYETIYSDVFPGTSRSRRTDRFNKFITVNGENLGFELTSITEARDYSYVTFNVASDGSIEDLYSSSSEVVLESSSSSEPAEESSSSYESVDFVCNQLDATGLSVSRMGDFLNISDLPQGHKIIRVFSLNGNLLKTLQVETSSVSLDVNRSFGNTPAIIQIAQNRRIIAVVPLK